MKRIVSNCRRRMLPCNFCSKSFDRPSLLNRHLRTHTGERPHACEICSKAFSTSSSLNTHRRIHSGEKPHECGVCGKKFTASSNLYYHRMTHVKVSKATNINRLLSICLVIEFIVLIKQYELLPNIRITEKQGQIITAFHFQNYCLKVVDVARQI